LFYRARPDEKAPANLPQLRTIPLSAHKRRKRLKANKSYPIEEIDRRFDTPDPKLDASRAAKYASLFIQYFGTERTDLFCLL
jgi:hypothetical protein